MTLVFKGANLLRNDHACLMGIALAPAQPNTRWGAGSARRMRSNLFDAYGACCAPVPLRPSIRRYLGDMEVPKSRAKSRQEPAQSAHNGQMLLHALVTVRAQVFHLLSQVEDFGRKCCNLILVRGWHSPQRIISVCVARAEIADKGSILGSQLLEGVHCLVAGHESRFRARAQAS